MDYFKQQLDRIQQQLAGLNASQRMLAACLVAIIVMTVAWWGRQAGNSETAALFEASVDAAEAGHIKNILARQGIRADIGGDNKITVPVARWDEAYATIAASDALPKNQSINFESFMKGINPFTSPTMGDAHLIHFKQARLAEVLRAFPGVRSADVFIDPSQKSGLSGNKVEPSATVTLTVKHPKEFTQSLVDGAANLMMGAQAGLTWKKVAIIVNGAPRRVTDPDTRTADGRELLAERENYQQIYADKVVSLLKIPGLSVSVSVGINDTSMRRRSHTYDKKNSFNIEAKTEEKTTESTGGAGGPGGEPGARPNVGMSLGDAQVATAGGSTSTESDSKTTYEVFPSDVVEESVRSAGLTDPTAAAVLVPRSHVINELKVRAKPDAPEPDDAAVEAWCQREFPKLQQIVMNTVMLSSPDKVSMGLYSDAAPLQALGAAGAAPAAVSTASIAAMAGAHSREIMLGGLAVVSLFMVSMMVRKAGPASVALPVGIQQTIPMPVLDATEALAGEVGEGKSMLDAMELDEDAVRAQQMVDQVAAMVEDNPDAAAGLVKRWMSRT